MSGTPLPVPDCINRLSNKSMALMRQCDMRLAMVTYTDAGKLPIGNAMRGLRSLFHPVNTGPLIRTLPTARRVFNRLRLAALKKAKIAPQR